MTLRAYASLPALLLAASLATQAHAQVPPKTEEAAPAKREGPRMTQAAQRDARNEQLPVLQRVQPAYDPLGVNLGAFVLYPSLSIGLGSDDNLASSNTNEIDDTYIRVTPELNFKSRFKRHSASLLLRGDVNRFSEYESENNETFLADGKVDLDLANDYKAGLQLTHENGVEKRGIVVPNAAEPITFTRDRARLSGSKVFDRVKLSGFLQNTSYDFDNNEDFTTNTPIDLSYRNRTDKLAQGRFDYAFSHNLGVFASAILTDRDYDSPTATRDSKIGAYQIGTRFNLSSLVTAEIGAGLYNQEFDNPALADIDGLSLDAHLDWNPTALTTVSFDALSQPSDPGIATASSAKFGLFAAQVDHELLRNLVLTARYQKSKYEFVGIDRDDSINELTLSANWLLSRRFGLKFGLRRFDLASEGVAATSEFTSNEALVSLQIRY